MPAVSDKQRKFMGVVKAIKQGNLRKSGKAGKAADSMTDKQVDDFLEMSLTKIVDEIVMEMVTKRRLAAHNRLK